VASLAVILQNLWEVRSSRIIPAGVIEKTKRLAALGRWEELRRYTTQEDDTFISRVVRGAMATTGEGRGAVREAAELAVSEECARLFRRIEPLNIIGNLGPLLGLAGTVWGMIIAFTSLGQGGGEANPGELALGISKALFHTLLGLMLAVPSLLAFGFFRTAVDRICNRAMMESSAIVELLPESAAERGAVPAVPTDHRHAMGRTTGAPHPPAHAPAAVVGAPERSPG
jgi:biopolymer transport protein ExbB